MRVQDDVVKDYRLVPEDFVKHLFSTLAVVIVVVLLASLLFGVPEATPLTIKSYASKNPVAFEQMALRALDGQGRIASYGPPYNHGNASVQTSIQSAVGVIHPVNAATDFILKPLAMASIINPAIGRTLGNFNAASPAQQKSWETAYTTALSHGVYRHGAVVTPKGNFGPLPALMNDVLLLGKSGLMSGALIRNGSIVTRFDNQNYLLFLQGTPMHQIAKPLALTGEQWGIIHPAVPGYPGAWWMTIPTWVYQWSFVANNAAADAMALSIGFLFWLALALVPWIPGLNRLPRYLGVHRLIWKEYYRSHSEPPASDEEGRKHAS
ncbi:cytochrome B6 [Sulfobacillus harzensis]|uniref:Cytochrome B6 n=1 Tax=Sulfobacillus harzensis TaxID=2729629 RepID=A0A7Y0Q128_9FIRM|nr:cytochrome B6 [Sulfobacillus harzensis]NMP21032.1 cytochrome B6 [Sulfobacillus harzensis]